MNEPKETPGAGPAIVPECSLCWAPLVLPREERTCGYHFCTQHCRDLLEEVSWDPTKGNPRTYYKDQYTSKDLKPECDHCDEPRLTHLSGMCSSCNYVMCGVCVTEVELKKICPRCGENLIDYQKLKEYFEDKSNQYSRRVIAGRLMTGIAQLSLGNSEMDRSANTFLLQNISDMGDLQSDFVLLCNKNQLLAGETDDLRHLLHLAILGHSSAQEFLSYLWNEKIFPGDIPAQKMQFWLETAADNYDRKANYILADQRFTVGDFEGHMRYLKRAAKLCSGDALAELGIEMEKRGQTAMALRYYEKSLHFKSDLGILQIRIAKAEGKLGFDQELEKQTEEIKEMFETHREDVHSKTNKYARMWLATNYHGDSRIKPFIDGFPRDQKYAREILDEGIIQGDRDSMVMVAKIIFYEKKGDLKKSKGLLERALGDNMGRFEDFFV